VSLVHPIDVRTPVELNPVGDKDLADDKRGYRSVWRYAAVDQFGRRLPDEPLPVEVFWTSPPSELFPGNNWTRSPSGQRTVSSPREIFLSVALAPLRTERR
jgi:hypothetical protein